MEDPIRLLVRIPTKFADARDDFRPRRGSLHEAAPAEGQPYGSRRRLFCILS